MSSFIKEEIGHKPGRMVVSAVTDDAVIWQKSVEFSRLEHARDLAAKAIAKSHRLPINTRPLNKSEKSYV